LKKVWLNYAVDVVIGIVFIFSAISGLVFLVPIGWINYSGVAPTFLGLNFFVWDSCF